MNVRRGLESEPGSPAIYRQIAARVIPFVFICYLFNYVDRVNVGFAKLEMLDDLGMSETVYGLAAGIFFVGYLAFGIPSNLALQKVGARRWIALMMVSWGALSTALMFVRSPTSFYVLRFLTGAAEAGFFPGVVLYLTRWFPGSRHGRVITMFMSAIPISGVLGGPASGWILRHFSESQNGLAAWQWLFLLQGVPTILLGIASWFVLSDGAEDARWLSAPSRQALQEDLRREAEEKGDRLPQTFGAALRSPATWVLGLLYFCIQSGVYGINFWLPTIIRDSGERDPLLIGLLSAVPYFAAVLFMLLTGSSADRQQERRWHLVVPLGLSMIGVLITASAPHQPMLALAGMTLATMGALTGLPLFWPLGSMYLSAAAAAGGFALINSCGQIAGFLSPYIFGLVKSSTGSLNGALYLLAMCMAFGMLIVARMPSAGNSDSTGGAR